jgi:5-methylcytosine-specific restriction enzyme A
MSIASEIEPKQHQRVMDLVREAGIDVSDWKNFKGGKQKASVNPKYCYEWSFVGPGKVVALNL